MALALLAVPSPASANHEYDGMMPTGNYNVICLDQSGPETGQVCQTDNANVYWYADGSSPGELESNDLTSLRNMLNSEYGPTDLVLTYDSSPVFSGDAETDIVYQEAESGLALPAGLLGAMWCNGAAQAFYECDQAYVRIVSSDGYRIHDGSVACHETGHAVGLVHGDDASPRLNVEDNRLGCMESGAQFPAGLGASSAHLINATY